MNSPGTDGLRLRLPILCERSLQRPEEKAHAIHPVKMQY